MPRAVPAMSLALLCAIAHQAGAQTTGSMPYATLSKLFADFLSMPAQNRDKLIFIERVLSRAGTPLNPPPHVTIQSASGTIPALVAADGTLTIPLTPALRAENPSVAIDQPKGAMNLQIMLAVAIPPHQRAPYAWFLAAGAQARDAIAIVARASGGMLASVFTPRLRGLAISFPAGTTAEVALVTPAGREILPPGPNGVVHLPLDRPPAGTDVEFSSPPSLIEPVID
jgi:hypothetical protein